MEHWHIGQHATYRYTAFSLPTCHMAIFMVELKHGNERINHDGRGTSSTCQRAGMEPVHAQTWQANVLLRSKVEKRRGVSCLSTTVAKDYQRGCTKENHNLTRYDSVASLLLIVWTMLSSKPCTRYLTIYYQALTRACQVVRLAREVLPAMIYSPDMYDVVCCEVMR